jgi:hypothetical protein
VHVTAVIGFDDEPDGVFPRENDVQIFTQLENPHVNVTILRNGRRERGYQTVNQVYYTLDGFDLSYDESVIQLRIDCDGRVPPVTPPRSIQVFKASAILPSGTIDTGDVIVLSRGITNAGAGTVQQGTIPRTTSGIQQAVPQGASVPTQEWIGYPHAVLFGILAEAYHYALGSTGTSPPASGLLSIVFSANPLWKIAIPALFCAFILTKR